MRKILFIGALFVCSIAQSQTFPGTDSLRAFNNKHIRNSAINPFTNMRLNTLLKGIINEIDSTVANASIFDSTYIYSAVNAKSDSSHTHAAADITSGTFADARLSSNVALRDTNNFFTGNIDIVATDTLDYNPALTIHQTIDGNHRWWRSCMGGEGYFFFTDSIINSNVIELN